MSIEQTRNWIAKHKRKVDAQERWTVRLKIPGLVPPKPQEHQVAD